MDVGVRRSGALRRRRRARNALARTRGLRFRRLPRGSDYTAVSKATTSVAMGMWGGRARSHACVCVYKVGKEVPEAAVCFSREN